jgi:hypothetical protein
VAKNRSGNRIDHPAQPMVIWNAQRGGLYRKIPVYTIAEISEWLTDSSSGDEIGKVNGNGTGGAILFTGATIPAVDFISSFGQPSLSI